MALSYLGFLALVGLPPLAGLLLDAWRRDLAFPACYRVGVPLLVLLALGYTAPWDDYLVARGVWTYAAGAVRYRIGHVPIEEYVFVALQTVVTALWVGRFDPPSGVAVTRRERVVGVLAGVAILAVGFVLFARSSTVYLGAILAWSGPVLAIQWGFGWPVLWRARRTVALGTLVPAAYFAVADRVAIWLGIWSLSPAHTTGLSLLGLPIEEALFFAVTTLFVVQGLVLFEWVIRT